MFIFLSWLKDNFVPKWIKKIKNTRIKSSWASFRVSVQILLHHLLPSVICILLKMPDGKKWNQRKSYGLLFTYLAECCCTDVAVQCCPGGQCCTGGQCCNQGKMSLNLNLLILFTKQQKLNKKTNFWIRDAFQKKVRMEGHCPN